MIHKICQRLLGWRSAAIPADIRDAMGSSHLCGRQTPAPLAKWTSEELAVLTPEHFKTEPPRMIVREPTFPEEPSRSPPPRSEQANPYHVYVVEAEPVEVDDRLALLRFRPIEHEPENRFRPIVSVTPMDMKPGRHAEYYFEFDTVDTFDSPNFWRTPQLLPFRAERDILGRAGVRYSLFRSGHHEPGGGSSVTFPFRITAMRLPDDWHRLDRAELERHALALGFGLDCEATVREVFDWIRHTIVWSAQTQVRSTLDVFATGVGACGQANAVCSLLLELNGIRSRGVSGFDPVVRARRNGKGGHSVAEVYDPDARRWSYIDPYLDLYLPGVPTAELNRFPIGDKQLWVPGNLRSLQRQFMYRRYFDRLNRMIPISMVQMDGDESTWGTQWPLVKPRYFEPQELFPEEATIHVRARYVVTNGQRVQHRAEVPVRASLEGIAASPWAHTVFTIRPRDLLGIA